MTLLSQTAWCNQVTKHSTTTNFILLRFYGNFHWNPFTFQKLSLLTHIFSTNNIPTRHNMEFLKQRHVLSSNIWHTKMPSLICLVPLSTFTKCATAQAFHRLTITQPFLTVFRWRCTIIRRLRRRAINRFGFNWFGYRGWSIVRRR